MARRRHNADGDPLAPGMVPPEFSELFAGAQENQLVPRLRSWLAQRYGSPRADLYWLVELAAKADRETVRLDAVKHLQLLFYGAAPQTVLVEAKEAARVTEPHRPPDLGQLAKVLGVLSTVGAFPASGDAGRVGEAADAEVEQVLAAHAGLARNGG